MTSLGPAKLWQKPEPSPGCCRLGDGEMGQESETTKGETSRESGQQPSLVWYLVSMKPYPGCFREHILAATVPISQRRATEPKWGEGTATQLQNGEPALPHGAASPKAIFPLIPSDH